nr:hypothetical protein Iba_chr03dCG8450 [Ipomoea batatas]
MARDMRQVSQRRVTASLTGVIKDMLLQERVVKRVGTSDVAEESEEANTRPGESSWDSEGVWRRGEMVLHLIGEVEVRITSDSFQPLRGFVGVMTLLVRGQSWALACGGGRFEEYRVLKMLTGISTQ